MSKQGIEGVGVGQIKNYETDKSFVTPHLINMLSEQYALSSSGIHGPSHWARVLANGRRLTEKTEANLDVVELFAVLHDSQRVNDERDPEHGPRAAEFALSLQGDWFHLSSDELNLLFDACSGHTNGHTEADITIQTCWDSDRLDLGRVGITPHPDRLCTKAAKSNEMLEWAHYQRWEQRPIPPQDFKIRRKPFHRRMLDKMWNTILD